MSQIMFTSSDDTEERFRKQARKAFGYKYSSTSKAADQALQQWAERREILESDVVPSDDPIDAIHGLLAHVDSDSVSLQEQISQQRHVAYQNERQQQDQEETNAESATDS
jgi:hypothetical protein